MKVSCVAGVGCPGDGQRRQVVVHRRVRHPQERPKTVRIRKRCKVARLQPVGEIARRTPARSPAGAPPKRMARRLCTTLPDPRISTPRSRSSDRVRPTSSWWASPRRHVDRDLEDRHLRIGIEEASEPSRRRDRGPRCHPLARGGCASRLTTSRARAGSPGAGIVRPVQRLGEAVEVVDRPRQGRDIDQRRAARHPMGRHDQDRRWVAAGCGPDQSRPGCRPYPPARSSGCHGPEIPAASGHWAPDGRAGSSKVRAVIIDLSRGMRKGGVVPPLTPVRRTGQVPFAEPRASDRIGTSAQKRDGTTCTTAQNSGNSQPPPSPEKSQPLPECTQVAPSSTGIRPSDTSRVATPRISARPPPISAAMVR